MSFILAVLIIGALLSLIFGRRVAAMFVTGTATVVGLLFGVLLLLLSPLIWGFLTTPSRVERASSDSYTAPAPSLPSYTPAAQASAPTYQASAPYAPPPLPASAAPAAVTGPRIGVALNPVPAGIEQYMNADLTGANAMPAGMGCLVITVSRNSPADSAGLQPNDVLLSGGAPGQKVEWITPSYQLPALLDRAGYGVPVLLNVYRVSERRSFSLWVKPR